MSCARSVLDSTYLKRRDLLELFYLRFCGIGVLRILEVTSAHIGHAFLRIYF
jgi:hypothetical protein